MADIQATLDKVLAKLDQAVEQLLTLEVTTVVTAQEVKAGANGKDWSLSPVAGQVEEALKTTVRLDQGDITNEMTPGALENKALSDFHAAQVALSREIIAGNVKGLADLVRELAD